jgi:hypothetical protein
VIEDGTANYGERCLEVLLYYVLTGLLSGSLYAPFVVLGIFSCCLMLHPAPQASQWNHGIAASYTTLKCVIPKSGL